jgi:ubiquinone/menaquinone biosynthesis C-methylase UbiE
MTFFLGGLCRQAWGVDIDAEKLDFAEQELARRGCRNVKFRASCGAEIPFDDDSFDCVMCVDVIEHLPDPAHFLREFYRVLRPSGRLLLSFGPPWFHPHGKHMWSRLPGYWTHLLFPRSVVMEVRGYPAETTWEDIGLHRLSVGKFHRAVRSSRFDEVFVEHRVRPALWPIASVPVLRELFISEVVGVFRKPAPEPGIRALPSCPEAVEC